MRVLWKDYCKKFASTFESLFGEDNYPASNVADQFLNAPFVSISNADTVTITLDQNRPISGVYVAGCNCAKFTLEIKNEANATVYGPTEIDNTTNVKATYFTAVQGNQIIVSADIGTDGLAPFIDPDIDDGSSLKIKGIGVGDPANLPRGVISGFSLPMTTGTRASTSPAGQVLSTPLAVLEQREWELPEYTYEEMQVVRDDFKELNIQNPTYFDAFDCNDGEYEEPLYMVLLEPIGIRRTVGRGLGAYRITMLLQEAR